jgi:hypothetical protein
MIRDEDPLLHFGCLCVLLPLSRPEFRRLCFLLLCQRSSTQLARLAISQEPERRRLSSSPHDLDNMYRRSEAAWSGTGYEDGSSVYGRHSSPSRPTRFDRFDRFDGATADSRGGFVRSAREAHDDRDSDGDVQEEVLVPIVRVHSKKGGLTAPTATWTAKAKSKAPLARSGSAVTLQSRSGGMRK